MQPTGKFPPMAGNVVPPIKPKQNPNRVLAGLVRPPKAPNPRTTLPPMAGKVLPTPTKTVPSKKAIAITAAIITTVAAVATAIIAKIKGNATK